MPGCVIILALSRELAFPNEGGCYLLDVPARKRHFIQLTMLRIMHINPYIAGNPIDNPAAFFGREDVFRDVLAVLINPHKNAIVVYGQRRIGKTSILLQLENRLAENGQYTPVYFDLMDKAGKPLIDVLQELAWRINQALDELPPEPSLFDTEGVYFRDTFLPQAAKLAAPGGLALLFDEFDVLDSPENGQTAGQKFFPYLRAWMNKAVGVQFVFVIGRRPEDLTIDTMPTFKGTNSSQVALLDRRDTEKIIHQAEEDGSLRWMDEAVDAVWECTKGHPYFTQLLCEAVWNDAYRDEPKERPTITPEMVKMAIIPAFVAGANAFVWLWDGLPPAERIVTAAIAEATQPVISQDDLITILSKSGVRMISRQLELAPDMLEQWGLLRRVDGGYCFAVPLLRQWVQKNRPLRLVKEELDKLEPMAERLFQIAQDDYSHGDLEEAERNLRRVRDINPNHLKAQVLLGQIYLDQGHLSEAVEVLGVAYAYDARAARKLLTMALLNQVEMQTDEVEQLATYKRILQVTPSQPEAKARYQAILDAQRKRELANKQADVARLAEQEDWDGVIRVYKALQEISEEEADWQAELTKAQNLKRLQQQYNEAVGALENDDYAKAKQLLAAIIAEAPEYKLASRYLLQTVEKIDVGNLKEQILSQEQLVKELQKQILDAEEQSRANISSLQKNLADTQQQLESIEHKKATLESRIDSLENDTAQLQIEKSATDEQKRLLEQQYSKSRRMFGGLVMISFLVLIAITLFTMRFTQLNTISQQEDVFIMTQTASAVSANGTIDTLQNQLALALLETPQQPAVATLRELSTPLLTSTPTKSPTSTATPTITQATTQIPTIESTPPLLASLGDLWVRPKDGMVMMYVPAGSFLMGSDPLVDPLAEDDEMPQHEVTLSAYWIDKTEVTVAQYKIYLTEMLGKDEGIGLQSDTSENPTLGHGNKHLNIQRNIFQPVTFDEPVFGVTWTEADAYCRWLSHGQYWGRLPTEAQWEYAARSSESWIYPWGNNFDGARLNFGKTSTILGLAPVGSFPEGASWVGAEDMAGNVWEWVSDWYGIYNDSPQENPLGLSEGAAKVLKGGSWVNDQQFVRSAYRGVSGLDVEQDSPKVDTLSTYGFRCVIFVITPTPTPTRTPSNPTIIASPSATPPISVLSATPTILSSPLPPASTPSPLPPTLTPSLTPPSSVPSLTPPSSVPSSTPPS